MCVLEHRGELRCPNAQPEVNQLALSLGRSRAQHLASDHDDVPHLRVDAAPVGGGLSFSSESSSLRSATRGPHL